MCYVYRISLPSGRSYIGVANDPVDRLQAHARSPYAIGRALRKYGVETAQMDLLFEGSSEECFEREGKLIESLRTMVPDGYNMASGGKGVTRHSDEVRQRMSEAAKARWSDPVKRAIALASITTPEVKARQRAAQLGRVRPREVVDRITMKRWGTRAEGNNNIAQ